MTKRKHRDDNLAEIIRGYTSSRTIELQEFTDIHKRLTDGYTVIDIWPTTGKYWVSQTTYYQMTNAVIRERGGEKGSIPLGEDAIYKWLDELFFAPDM